MRIERINHAVANAIQDIVYRFWDNPYTYLHNSELHAEMHAAMVWQMRGAVVTGSLYDEFGPHNVSEQRRTTLVKSVYPDNYEFDLAIVDSKADPREDIYSLPLVAAVEIVFQRDPGMDVCQNVLDDYRKLNEYWIKTLNRSDSFTGVALIFFHKKDKHPHFMQYVQGTPIPSVQLKPGINGIAVFEDGLLKF